MDEEMRGDDLILANPLIPHRGRMRLIEWVKRPTPNGLQAETTVREGWPLTREGTVSSLLGIELVAQTISALSTWHRGEGAAPRVGLLVGIKEAEFSHPRIPIGTRLSIQVEKLYQVGDYAVFRGQVSAESEFFCKIVIQAMEPGEETLSLLKGRQKSEPEGKERKN
jgi:predicted hotdog family 3-hydroxylacyl-ACP dehydratase